MDLYAFVKGEKRLMNKKIWDLYAPIYERAMRADRKVYQYMYDRIPQIIVDKDVLEIATGPGLLAKHVADAAKKMIATDYSEGMIAGISFEHQWSATGYQDFLKHNGWEILHSREMQARIAIVYTECVRKGEHPHG